MIVTATELAKDSKAILDKVIHHGEEVEIQRHGKTVAILRSKQGVSKEEVLRRLNSLDWTPAERATLKKVIAESADVFGYAGSD